MGMQLDNDHHGIRRIVAKLRPHEPKKAADGGTRSGHEKKRERHLGGDENAPAMLRGSSDSANLPVGKHMRGIAPGKTQCRDKSEEDATEQRKSDGGREER